LNLLFINFIINFK